MAINGDGYEYIGEDSRLYYGICDTAADQPIKEVVIQNPVIISDELDLKIGDQLIVNFVKGNEVSNGIQLQLRAGDYYTSITYTNAGIVNNNYLWETESLIRFVYIQSGNAILDDEEEPDDELEPEDTTEEEEEEIIDTGGNNQNYEPPVDSENFSEEGEDFSTGENENDGTVPINTGGFYWKIIEADLASIDKYGLVKLATESDNVQAIDSNTVANYDLVKVLVKEAIDNLGIIWETNLEGEEQWGKITLISELPENTSTLIEDEEEEEEEPIDYKTAFIPKLITSTNELVNNGDQESEAGSKYIQTGDGFWYFDIPNDAGIGFKNNEENIITIKPYSYDDQLKNQYITIGERLLELYQTDAPIPNQPPTPYVPQMIEFTGTEFEEGVDYYVQLPDETYVITDDIEPQSGIVYYVVEEEEENNGEIDLRDNPIVQIYGKEIINGIDFDNGNFSIGYADLLSPSYIPVLSIDKNGVSINGEIDVTGGITANSLNVAGEANVDGLNINGISIDDFVDSKISSIEISFERLNSSTIVPTGSPTFIIKDVLTDLVKAVGKQGYRYNIGDSNTNLTCPVPVISDYIPLGVVGWNVDREANSSYYTGFTTVWECYLTNNTTTPTLNFAMSNLRENVEQHMHLHAYVLYVRRNWGG